MKNLVFMLWLLLWPLFSSVSTYFNARIDLLRGYDPPSYNTAAFVAFVEIVVWVGIAILLYEGD